MSRQVVCLLLVLGAVTTMVALPAISQTLPPGGTFFDGDGNLHEGNIEAISAAGITTGWEPLFTAPPYRLPGPKWRSY